ncbi:hypothetical protein PENTCL1PPCAC_17408 [Pristionchus entomophagus]|uniref:Chitin-binding type-2 domain-containing protein n=1 Tax=Pristionchus entomophagus TaxID=358040 RepID=A0AAV5TLE2_9BILA|nr:hypothetical protein PENTCL1PPCAC_17408 [Pristionchus entomophagus]
MGRYRESRTGIAVLAFIVASAAAQFNSPADLRGDCSDKTDGIYPTGHCSTYFLECSGGATTKQNCSDGLWFNPLTSQCDYREKIAACQDAFSCVGREDGVYGEGCSSMFWYCTGGQLKHTTCNTGLFFNVETQKCDYRGNIRACGGSSKTSSPSKTRSHRLTTVTSTTASTAVPLTTVSPTTVSPTTMNTEQARMVGRDWTEVPYGQTYPTYPPRQRISGTVSKTPLAESSAGTACAGKEDGSHEKEECSSQYVLCWAGTGQVMNCPSSLMFNKENGQCDYPLNVAGCTGSSSVSLEGAVPSLSSPPGYGSGSSPLVSAAPSSASLPIPRQPVEMDCSGRSDGEYALSPCTRHYFQCVSGSAYTRSCNKGLVYNPANNQCDHKKNCGLASSSVVAADAPTTVIPVTSTTKTSIGLDCSSLSDGLYSRGCVTEYSQCAAGIFYLRKCPGGLVFDDVTKACDYPEICSAPSTIPQDILPSGYSRPSTTVSPTTAATVTFDCSSRVDGLYSDGCISWYLECSSGVATPFQCPSGLVFDGVNHKCDYADKCGQPRPLEHDPSDYSQSQSIPSTHPTHSILAQSTPIAFDCSSRVDGLYGNGCSPLFYQCVSGMAVSQSCPTGLMFHQKTRGCEYKCEGEEGVEEAVVEDATMPPVKPTLTHPSIDCYNRPDGLYSSGCSRSFVQCVNGLVFDRLCPEGLVFLQESGRCEYPSSCGSVPWMGASPVSLSPSPLSFHFLFCPLSSILRQ